MIRDLQLSQDAAGFPVVSWTEDRNLSSPEAMSRARVECRIMKHPDTGMLLFVARGSVRHGAFEEGKPWERLRGFSKHTAESLYYTRKELELRHHFQNKGIGSKLAMTDSAQVLLAEFVDDTPLHINCADATPVDIDRLHLMLAREFVGNQHMLVGNLCRIAFEWPVDDDRVLTHDIGRSAGQNHPIRGFIKEAFGWIVAVGVVGALILGFLWLLGAYRL